MAKLTIGKTSFLLAGFLLQQTICFSQSTQKIDFRYSPPWWQTLVCLPDDPVKTLVGKEGQIFGDYGYKGPREFSFSLLLDGQTPFVWKDQKLETARTPMTHTVKTSGAVQLDEQTFLEIPGEQLLNTVERYDSRRTEKNWSKPNKPADASFNDIAMGLRGLSGEGIVEFHVKVTPGAAYNVVLGFCEGQWDTVGKRAMRIYVEGTEQMDIDPVKDFGFHVPGVYTLRGNDKNKDGILTIVVTNRPGADDRNAFVNGLWLFKAQVPAAASIVSGKENKTAVLYAPAAHIRMPERRYQNLVKLTNTGSTAVNFQPVMRYAGIEPIKTAVNAISIGDETSFSASNGIASLTKDSATKYSIRLNPVALKPGEVKYIALVLSRFYAPGTTYQAKVETTTAARDMSKAWWQKNSPSASAISVPDSGIQAIVESSVRNIFQARDIRKGSRSFHVGPTIYRGLWLADGSFLLEVATMLDYTKDVRDCIDYLTHYQLPDGGFEMINTFHKENGLVLFMLSRHAMLTQDKEWLKANWSVLEGCIHRINYLRAEAMKDSTKPYYTLLPDGNIDGGIQHGNDYSNTEWCLGGMKWAIWAAKWIGKNEEAATWQKEYDDFYAKFMTLAKKDLRKDDKGNTYLPVMIKNEQNQAPPKGQWAFCQSVYPGMVFDDDSVARQIASGTMDMLHDHREEGLVLNTGWMEQGLWTYFSSFYGHALEWLGRGDQMPQLLYDYGNHASPTMVWREEQKPVGKGYEEVGDMPHNWASAEFIRMVVHMIELDHGKDLHLFQGFPKLWARAGAVTKLNGIRTPYGRINLVLEINSTGDQAALLLDFLDEGNLPDHVVIHKNSWTRDNSIDTLAGAQQIKVTIPVK